MLTRWKLQMGLEIEGGCEVIAESGVAGAHLGRGPMLPM
jgi:hypothetical protein